MYHGKTQDTSLPVINVKYSLLKFLLVCENNIQAAGTTEDSNI